MQRRCLNCFNLFDIVYSDKEEREVCPYCGYCEGTPPKNYIIYIRELVYTITGM